MSAKSGTTVKGSSRGHKPSRLQEATKLEGSRVTKRSRTKSSRQASQTSRLVDEPGRSTDTRMRLRVSPTFSVPQIGRYNSTNECFYNWTYQHHKACDVNARELWDEWEMAESAVYQAGEESVSGVGQLSDTLTDRVDRFRATVETEVARLTEGAGFQHLELLVGAGETGDWKKVKKEWVKNVSVKQHSSFDLRSASTKPAASDAALSGNFIETAPITEPTEH